jgi:site-specific DNA recombinase
MTQLHPPLGKPKDGHTYQIIVVCRVSDPGPGKQDPRSLEDQSNLFTKLIAENAQGPRQVKTIAGSGSGELLDRKEYDELIELIATSRYDLVLCEDLGRIVRRIHAHLICEHCEDHGSRLIAINDHVDTAQPGWREASIFAAMHHERSNRDTSERIKRAHRSRFMAGLCLRAPAYGWIKPPGAKTDAEMRKDPDAEAIYAQWFRMLDMENASFAEVARWLKSQGVKFCTRKNGIFVDPTPQAVARHTFNPLLKGIRERNRRKSRRVNSSGHYVSVKAEPEELLQRPVSHLAFFDEAYFDRVTEKLKDKNACFRRAKDFRRDPCRHRPRRRTRYPGQVVTCGICGHGFVWGGHGQTYHLMCSGAKAYACWNGITFDGTFAAKAIAAAVYAEIEELTGFDSTFMDTVRAEAAKLDEDRGRRIADLKNQWAANERAIGNFVKYIGDGDNSTIIHDELKKAAAQRQRIESQLTAAEREPIREVQIPELKELKRIAREQLENIDVTSEPFARIMRRLVPSVVVFPVRRCDDGRPVLRARITLHISELIAEGPAREALRRPLQRELLADLFEATQPAAFRERVVAGRAAGKTERTVATELGITVTAAQHAMALQRQMDELGITDPYITMEAPPDDCGRFKRHLHKAYLFQPLPKPDAA